MALVDEIVRKTSILTITGLRGTRTHGRLLTFKLQLHLQLLQLAGCAGLACAAPHARQL